MQNLSHDDYLALTRRARLLASETIAGDISPKVLCLQDGTILKLFRLKRRFSSALFSPYALRFRRHAAVIARLGIPTVDVQAVYAINAIRRTAVHYRPLPGTTLRDQLIKSAPAPSLARALGRCLHHLHRNGIYFRSIHFGNIIITPDNDLGLIDLADIRVKRNRLRTGLRIRNLRHFFRAREDVARLAPVQVHVIESYLAASRMNRRNQDRFRQAFTRYFTAF
ncbi:MAG: hypothetical protein JJV98_01760 [Desulfosarcina sp.]|nr:hypothetical protein [Desulfobacterales bacterium]